MDLDVKAVRCKRNLVTLIKQLRSMTSLMSSTFYNVHRFGHLHAAIDYTHPSIHSSRHQRWAFYHAVPSFQALHTGLRAHRA
jgi:hypothetical protein